MANNLRAQRRSASARARGHRSLLRRAGAIPQCSGASSPYPWLLTVGETTTGVVQQPAGAEKVACLARRRLAANDHRVASLDRVRSGPVSSHITPPVKADGTTSSFTAGHTGISNVPCAAPCPERVQKNSDLATARCAARTS